MVIRVSSDLSLAQASLEELHDLKEGRRSGKREQKLGEELIWD